jgi:hypothetical protein
MKVYSGSLLPSITEERQHVAEIISRIFESGLGSEDVHEYFEEEIETTVLARKGRGELTLEYVKDLLTGIGKQLEFTKQLIDIHGLPTKVEKEVYNANLQELIVAEGSLITHLGIEDFKINIENLKL